MCGISKQNIIYSKENKNYERCRRRDIYYPFPQKKIIFLFFVVNECEIRTDLKSRFISYHYTQIR